jgi:hypothetical protein
MAARARAAYLGGYEMRFGSKFALLLGVAVAALSFGATSSFATTVTVNGVASDVFSGTGSGTLTGATTFGTITCTPVAFTTDERTGGTAGDGLGLINFTFASCSANLGAGTCTVSSTPAPFEIGATGAHGTNTVDPYTIDSATWTVVCDAVVNCTATVTTTTATTNLGGTIDDAATTATLTGTTRASAGTTHCTGTVSASFTITEDISIAV